MTRWPRILWVAGWVLLATMVPLPSIFYNAIAAPLQLFASDVSTNLAQLLGIAVYRDGNVIHLANISLRLGRKIRWDPEKEQIVGDAEANRWLVRPYRKPWDDVLRSFKL